jgi:hypothetical protein
MEECGSGRGSRPSEEKGPAGCHRSRFDLQANKQPNDQSVNCSDIVILIVIAGAAAGAANRDRRRDCDVTVSRFIWIR